MPSSQLDHTSILTELGRLSAVWWASGAGMWWRSLEGGYHRGLRAWLDAAHAGGGAGLAHSWLGGAVEAYKSHACQSGWLPPLGRCVGAPAAVARGAGRSIPLPARIDNASQGLAFYAVPLPAAQGLIDELDSAFRAVSITPGKALLCLFMVDYRASELGAFVEFGVSVYVTPRARPAALPGKLMVAHLVNRPSSRDASRAIWGLPSMLTPDMAIDYDTDRVCCRVRGSGETGLTICFPRARGDGYSSEIPVIRYATIDGAVHATQFVRSGSGEHIAAGGRIDLSLCHPRGCPCAGDGAADRACVCRMLAGLGLPAAPMGYIWTERMSGAFGAPQPLDGGPRLRANGHQSNELMELRYA